MADHNPKKPKPKGRSIDDIQRESARIAQMARDAGVKSPSIDDLKGGPGQPQEQLPGQSGGEQTPMGPPTPPDETGMPDNTGEKLDLIFAVMVDRLDRIIDIMEGGG